MAKSYKELIKNNKFLDQNVDTKQYQAYLKSYEEVDKDIRAIAGQYFDYKESYILPKKLRGIKNYIMYKGDRAVFIERSKKDKWKSNSKSALTKIITDLVYSKIFNLDFQVYSRSIKDPNARETDEAMLKGPDMENSQDTPDMDVKHVSVDENQAFADFCFSSSEARHGLSQQIWDLVSVGEGYAYVDMLTSDKLFEFNKELGQQMANMESPTKEDKAKIKATLAEKPMILNKSNAVYRYIPFSNVVYEFDKDFYDSSFVGVFIFDDIDVYLASRPYIKMTDASKHYVVNTKKPIRGKDYNKVKLLSSYNDYVLKNCRVTNINSQETLDNMIMRVEGEIVTGKTEVNKKKGEIYEHWTDDTLTVFFNGNIIYDGANPVLPGIKPIIRMNKADIGGCTTSEGTTETLADIQKSFDLIFNSSDDALKATLSPLFYSKGYANLEGVGDYIPIGDSYKIIKGDLDSIQKLETIRFDYGVLRMLDYYWQQAILAVGLNNVSAYTDGSVQQTTSNFNKLYSLSLDVLKPAIFSIGFGLTKAFKVWSILAEKKLPPSIKVKVTGDDSTSKDVVIRLSNLLSDTEIVYEPLSINDNQYQNIVNNFTLFSNFLQANKQDPITGVINYDNSSVIKQFGKSIGLKGFYLTDEQFYEKKRKGIEAEFELEKLKVQKQQEVEALRPTVPQPFDSTPNRGGESTNVGKTPETPLAPDLFENVFPKPVETAG